MLVSSLGFAVPAPAFANTSLPNPGAGTTTSTTQVSQECVDQFTALYREGKISSLETDHCSATVVNWTSAATTPDEYEVINSMTGLSAAQQSEINASLNAGTIRSKSWKQTMNGGNYSQSHYGTFYYDGARAWSTVSYRNRLGSHRCATNYSIGVAITTQYCDSSWNGSYLQESHSYLVSYIFRGFPANYKMKMVTDLYKSGTVAYR